jgi:DNA-directed RNA polymerase subunit RPC12/RpoP
MTENEFNKYCRGACMISTKGLRGYDPATNNFKCPHCGKTYPTCGSTFNTRDEVYRYHRDGMCPICQSRVKEQ